MHKTYRMSKGSMSNDSMSNGKPHRHLPCGMTWSMRNANYRGMRSPGYYPGPKGLCLNALCDPKPPFSSARVVEDFSTHAELHRLEFALANHSGVLGLSRVAMQVRKYTKELLLVEIASGDDEPSIITKRLSSNFALTKVGI